MKNWFPAREFAPRTYTRAERLSDATIHVIGLVSALIGIGVLITLAVLWRNPTEVAATLVYAICLMLMLSASAAYHMTPHRDWKELLGRLDQSAIYIKIAGTYTPFAILSGASFGLLLTGIWGAAIAGLSLKMLAPRRLTSAALALYLVMGWAGVLFGPEFLNALEPTALVLMLIGGGIYTAGVVFYLWDTLPFHNTIWHAFVLVATAIFYVAVLFQVSAAPMVVEVLQR